MTENRTKEPSIGFTIDFLYLDEFAKVPNNIVEPYYGAVIPTVSSVENSRIIITSTPDGFNLFHKLLTDAERDITDPLKNMYAAMRVYWWQVKGRKDVRMFPLMYKLKQYKIELIEILDELKELGYNLYVKHEDGKNYHCIKYDETNEYTDISYIRTLRIRNIPLSDMFVITNWKEEQTKLIGGEDMFNQEYGLQFITGAKLLFSTEQMERFKGQSRPFRYLKLDKLDNRILLPYDNLKWIDDDKLINIAKFKDYYNCLSIDLGEGLGEDYTVINIFRLMPKSKELIELTHMKLTNIYEYFQLVQVGMFRVNNWAISEIAELLYVLVFELLDPEKTKIVLEYNTYGSTLTSKMPHVFEGDNFYSSGVFLRYKHRKEDTEFKIGLKITGGEQEASKKILIKSLQDAVKKQLMMIYNDVNINELSLFTKRETSTSFTYKAESGNDDCAMSVVDLASIFSHVQYKNLIEHMMENGLDDEIKKVIEKYAYGKTDTDAVNYSSVNAYSKIYKTNNIVGKKTGMHSGIKQRSKFQPWKTSPWDK